VVNLASPPVLTEENKKTAQRLAERVQPILLECANAATKKTAEVATEAGQITISEHVGTACFQVSDFSPLFYWSFSLLTGWPKLPKIDPLSPDLLPEGASQSHVG